MADQKRMCVLFTYAIVLFVISGSLAAVFAAAEDEAKTPPEKKVTLQFSNTPVIDAIDQLFKDSGYKYTIEPGVSGSISLSFNNLPFTDTLKKLTDAAGLEYSVAGGRYVIRPKQKVELSTTAEPDRKANYEVPEQTPPQSRVIPEDRNPVYYGRERPRDYGPRASDVEKVVVIVPQVPIFTGPGYQGAPILAPPPRLMPPSFERLLATMAALEPFMRPRLFDDKLIGYPSFPAYQYKRYDFPYFDPYH